MRAFGTSMLPRIQSGSLLTFLKQDEYKVGDIVYCKVRGRLIDAHLIRSVSNTRGYLITNNHGHINGWTHNVYARVVKAEFPNKEVHYFFPYLKPESLYTCTPIIDPPVQR